MQLHVETKLVFKGPDGTFSDEELDAILARVKERMLRNEGADQGLMVMAFLDATVNVEDRRSEMTNHIKLSPGGAEGDRFPASGGRASTAQKRLISFRDVLNDTKDWTFNPFFLHLCAMSQRVRGGFHKSSSLGFGELLDACLMADLGDFLTNPEEPFSLEELRILLDYVEPGMVKGGDSLRTAIATGFIEAIVSRAADEPCWARTVMRALGPECRAYAEAWAGKDFS